MPYYNKEENKLKDDDELFIPIKAPVWKAIKDRCPKCGAKMINVKHYVSRYSDETKGKFIQDICPVCHHTDNGEFTE
tara:strand:+ start:216 stop:446 length:231 start_codon:yes stop_codon:yes gene_type:complete